MNRRTRFTTIAAALLAVAAAASAGGGEPAAAAAPGGKININQATAAQLALLPRIGEKVADRIVDYRKQHGNFSRPEDLMEVKGIGEKLFLVLKPYVTVSGPTTVTEKIRSGSSRGRARGDAAKKAPASAAPVGKER
jgi:competence protein ComEA